ncbi:MAG: WYL domain-containing protein [Butyrivibrio sp.]|nr:WYL domain-containing protein [Butyrivibrio sp.]
MDKITRVLLLYSKLIRGEPVSKFSFCMETDTSGRNFDRDIEDIRLYLSEMYQIDEVLYDRNNNNYYLSGIQRHDLEIIEFRFLENLLKEAKVLRKDELSGILFRLASNTKSINKYIEQSTFFLDDYQDMHSVALLKMHGDIEMMIRDKAVISIQCQYDNGHEKIVVIPCSIIYEYGHTYLVAYEETKFDDVSYFEIRKIDSFRKVRNQYKNEKDLVFDYLQNQKIAMQKLYCYAEFTLKSNKSDLNKIKRKFKSAYVSLNKKDEAITKIICNKEELYGWLMGQGSKSISLVGPSEAVQEFRKKIKDIMTIYEMEDVYGKEN